MKKILFILSAIILSVSCAKNDPADSDNNPGQAGEYDGVVTSFSVSCASSRATLDENEELVSWQSGDELNLMEVVNGNFNGVNQVFAYNSDTKRFDVARGGTGLVGGKRYIACFSTCNTVLPNAKSKVVDIRPKATPDYNESSNDNLIFISGQIVPQEQLTVTLKPLHTILWIGFETSNYYGEEFVANTIAMSAEQGFIKGMSIDGNGAILSQGLETYSDIEFSGLQMTINHKNDVGAQGSKVMCKVIPNPYASTALDYNFRMSGKADKDVYTLDFATKMDDQPLRRGKYELQVPIKAKPDVLEGTYKFTRFSFQLEQNPTVGKSVDGVIDYENCVVSVELPSYWTERTSLIPTFETSSNVTAIKIGDAVQQSGQTSNNYESEVVYTMEGVVGGSQEWKVRVVRPTTFVVPDAFFRSLIKAQDASLFDSEDKLIIARALANTSITHIGTDNGGSIGDFSGIEFLPAIQQVNCQGAKSTLTSIDLSRNNNLKLVQWWYASVTELNVSNAKGDAGGVVAIQCTAGDIKPRRVICQNIRSLRFTNPIEQIQYIDMRGGNHLGVLVDTGNFQFVPNSRVLMDKARWDNWTTNSPSSQAPIKSATNMTVELYDSNGSLVQTLKFNE